MRLLVNASNLVIGGGIGVGVWFIRKCLESNLDCYFALSPQVMNELRNAHEALPEDRVLLCKHSPSRSRAARAELLAFENNVNPDVVFTVFGPAYVTFTRPHVCGFADGWLSHSSPDVFKKVFANNISAAAKLLLSSAYKAFCIRRADAWIFEAKVAADGLAKRAHLDRNKCHVIANNCAELFSKTPVKEVDEQQVYNLLYFTADYPHKGITNYLQYAAAIRELSPELDFVFTITISAESATARNILQKAQELGLQGCFTFTGYVSINNAVELLDSANVVMQTSYLETFSANYPEAMSRNRPLIVSDFSFARDICKDAAIYVDPNDYSGVAKAIIDLYKNKELAEKLTENGRRILAELPNSEQRFSKYIDIIKSVALGDK